MSIQVILSILLENECDFGTVATESISARIRVDLERTLLGRGAKDMLHWIWIWIWFGNSMTDFLEGKILSISHTQ